MNDILETIYKSVVRLDRIVIDCIQRHDNHVIGSVNQILTQDFHLFCQKTIIVSNNCLNYIQLFAPKSDKTFESVLDNYLNKSYNNLYFSQNNDWIPKNDLNNYFIYNKNYFSVLYSILNETLFEYILNNCLIFEEIGSNCFQQILGYSVTNNVWNSTKLIKSENNYKNENQLVDIQNNNTIKDIKSRLNDSNISGNKVSVKRKSSLQTNDTINCIKKFKSNDCKTDINAKKVFQRPKKYVINRKSMLYSRQTTGRFSESHILEKNCLESHQLFKHIFNTSMRNVFTTNAKQILWPLFNQIIIRHKKCRFDKLLDKFCPIDSGFFDKFKYQLRYALELYSTHKQVFKLIYSVIYFVIPIQLLGTKSNFNAFYDNSKLLITCGLSTVLYNSDFRSKINFNEIKWFEEFANTSNAELISDSLIQWLIQYIISVLKSLFYITETANNKSLLFFYRYDVWQKMQSKAINQLVNENNLVSISGDQLSKLVESDSSKLLTLSSYRFVPKISSFRLINRLKPRVSSDIKQMKTLLKTILIILKKLRTISSISRLNSRQLFHKQIRRLKSKNLCPNNGTKLYYIRGDIADCYPSIDQNKLFSIIEELLESIIFENQITIKEFDHIIKGNNKLFAKHIRYVETFDTKLLPQIAIKNNIKLQNSIIVPKSYKKSYNCQQIKNYIKAYIFKAIIKSGKNSFLWMKSGIRQGGMLSSELCSIYVESLVHNYFSDLGTLGSEVRLIYADDFLFITPSLLRAKAIVEIMLNGFNDYKLKINFEKLKTNFEYKQSVLSASNDLKFFGHQIDIQTLTVSVDYSIYSDHNIYNTFNCNPNSSLKQILSIVLSKFNKIILIL